MLATIISQFLTGKKSITLGNLTPTRDLTYVADTCEGFIEIYKSDSLIGETINIGMNSEISIGDLTSFIANLMNNRQKPFPNHI